MQPSSHEHELTQGLLMTVQTRQYRAIRDPTKHHRIIKSIQNYINLNIAISVSQ